MKIIIIKQNKMSADPRGEERRSQELKGEKRVGKRGGKDRKETKGWKKRK